jgi:MoaA/NifB/PqqE/SkfB family radical SAM enzyme
MRLAKYLPEPIKQIIKSSFVYKLYLRRDLVKFPYAMNIELTNRCNLKCWMCPRPRMKNLKVGDIDFGLFKKIVDDMAKLADKRTKFTLTGLGEPLMYNKMSNAIEYVKMKCQKAPIHIDTNATLLDEEKSEMLCRLLGGGDWLLFSLNAGTQDTYESLMGADKFDLVVSHIKNFLAIREKIGKGPNVVIQLMETKKTVSEIEEFKKFWKPLVGTNDNIYVRPLLKVCG